MSLARLVNRNVPLLTLAIFLLSGLFWPDWGYRNSLLAICFAVVAIVLSHHYADDVEDGGQA